MGAKRKQQLKRKQQKSVDPPPCSEEETSEQKSLKAAQNDVEQQTSEDDSSDEDQMNTGFTDENAAWLKPKSKEGSQQLLSSDGEGSVNEDVEDEEDDNDLLEIEKEAQLVDEELKDEQREAEEELKRTIREHTAIYHLPTQEELARDVDRVVPPSEIRSHVESILEVLAGFKERREPGRARQEYIHQLGSYIAELYGYLPELVEYFLTMFSPAETLEFIDASDKPRPLVIRTNTLKARRKDLAAALIKRGVSLDPLASWSKVGLKISESPVPVGATPEYLSGMYMLQSAASMCPVLALAPQPNEKVLDMSAAPGGKTSYLAQLMRNTGVIFANDLKAERQKATVANLHRLGVTNVICCAHDGRHLGKMFLNRFDRILLDAPCSGLGVISRDPSVKVQRTLADVKQCAHLQKELLLAAIDALKYKNTSGGVMVYSTCSVSVFENEDVVNYALKKRDIQIVETGLDFGTPGFVRYQQKRFHPSMTNTRRFYPHTVNMDGFFVCKIKKLSDNGVEKRRGTAEDVEQIEEASTEVKTERKRSAERKQNLSGNRYGKERKQGDEAALGSETKGRVAMHHKNTQPRKKQKTNAKVTKPRRFKMAATDA